MSLEFKLLEAAQDRWQHVDGCELVPLMRTEATFVDGKIAERHDHREEEHDEKTTEERAA